MNIKSNRMEKNSDRSGVYLGGIGAGGFEIRPDGRFYRCQIFNDYRRNLMLEAFFFHRDRKNFTKILSTRDYVDVNKVVKGVDKIYYKGEFPKVELSFPDEKVNIKYLSFFSPGDLKNSSLPAVLCKVNGKGRLLFIISMPFECRPFLLKDRVILKSKEGELGIYSKNGRVFAAPKNNWLIEIFEKADKFPSYNVSNKTGNYYAGIYLEENFSDEIIISWYFPEMYDLENNFIGVYYSNFFKSCNDVLNYVIKNRDLLENKSDEFHKSIYLSGKPGYLKDSYSAQVSSFVKMSWLTKDFKFGVWEGSCCCCGLQTTDVAYYGSWLYLKMFPELEKRGLELISKFQRKDGFIPHLFPGTFKRIDEYRRKDMNMQFVLMVYRDYKYLNDIQFLRKMYERVKKAINLVYRWDTDGDLIPDIEGPDQTFDAWGWKGCSIYLATLWLATLRAGIEIGRIMNDKKLEEKCERDFKIVQENIIKKLWNGEYFILWCTEKERDEASLLDALTGDWYSYLLGLGHILPEDMIKSHLRYCLKHNRKRIDPSYMKNYYTPGERGFCYINGAYKDERRVSFQQYEPWTGIEYAFAIHLYIMGMRREALKVIKDVANRKKRCGMFFNHLECGGDYFRPMVIGLLWDLIKS